MQDQHYHKEPINIFSQQSLDQRSLYNIPLAWHSTCFQVWGDNPKVEGQEFALFPGAVECLRIYNAITVKGLLPLAWVTFTDFGQLLSLHKLDAHILPKYPITGYLFKRPLFHFRRGGWTSTCKKIYSLKGVLNLGGIITTG